MGATTSMPMCDLYCLLWTDGNGDELILRLDQEEIRNCTVRDLRRLIEHEIHRISDGKASNDPQGARELDAVFLFVDPRSTSSLSLTSTTTTKSSVKLLDFVEEANVNAIELATNQSQAVGLIYVTPATWILDVRCALSDDGAEYVRARLAITETARLVDLGVAVDQTPAFDGNPPGLNAATAGHTLVRMELDVAQKGRLELYKKPVAISEAWTIKDYMAVNQIQAGSRSKFIIPCALTVQLPSKENNLQTPQRVLILKEMESLLEEELSEAEKSSQNILLKEINSLRRLDLASQGNNLIQQKVVDLSANVDQQIQQVEGFFQRVYDTSSKLAALPLIGEKFEVFTNALETIGSLGEMVPFVSTAFKIVKSVAGILSRISQKNSDAEYIEQKARHIFFCIQAKVQCYFSEDSTVIIEDEAYSKRLSEVILDSVRQLANAFQFVANFKNKTFVKKILDESLGGSSEIDQIKLKLSDACQFLSLSDPGQLAINLRYFIHIFESEDAKNFWKKNRFTEIAKTEVIINALLRYINMEQEINKAKLELAQSLDKNKDGTVTTVEFKKWMGDSLTVHEAIEVSIRNYRQQSPFSLIPNDPYLGSVEALDAGPAFEALKLYTNSLDLKETLLGYLQSHVPGTTLWIEDIFEDWRQQWDERAMLWIVAGPGQGKSIISSQLIKQSFFRDLNKASSISTLAYHFFRFDKQELTDSRMMVYSLACQLCNKLTGFAKCLETALSDESINETIQSDISYVQSLMDRLSPRKAFQYFLKKPFDLLSKTSPHITSSNVGLIIIDAVDECYDFLSGNDPLYEQWDKPSLALILTELHEQLQLGYSEGRLPPIKIIFTGRPLSIIEKGLSIVLTDEGKESSTKDNLIKIVKLSDSTEALKSDIEIYCSTNLEAAQLGIYSKGSRSGGVSIPHLIADYSGGNFLWAKIASDKVRREMQQTVHSRNKTDAPQEQSFPSLNLSELVYRRALQVISSISGDLESLLVQDLRRIRAEIQSLSSQYCDSSLHLLGLILASGEVNALSERLLSAVFKFSSTVTGSDHVHDQQDIIDVSSYW
ncbi:hypothetical protein BJ742DRAFT_397607 [Cladochytrium replicatum]|nr:hypothetical protein BJ742DRAFT_397607 [Cladochytrium replicatum]